MHHICLKNNKIYRWRGNLAVNIQSINGDVKLYGSIGQDKEGYKILELLGNTNVTPYIANDHLITTTKTRLVSQNGQHIVRWDREQKYIGENAFNRLFSDATINDVICNMTIIWTVTTILFLTY